MSELVVTGAPLALREEVKATLLQLAVAGRHGLVVGLVFDAEGGVSAGAVSPDLTADEMDAAALQLERFAADTRARAKAARS